MKPAASRRSFRIHPISALVAVAAAMASTMTGCEVDSFFDPSKMGYFEHTPTTIPILDRLDVIEGRDQLLSDVSPVTREDLLPNDLTYRLSPGDALTVQIPELLQGGVMFEARRRIDTAGYFRISPLGEVPAAGLTPQEFEDEIIRRLQDQIVNPMVTVSVEEGLGFQYTVYGLIQQSGVYPLRRPDLRIREALAMAGGLLDSVSSVYVIREVPLGREVEPFTLRERGLVPPQPPGGRPDMPPPVDIETLIERLDKAPAPPAPGALGTMQGSMIDVDDLEPARVAMQPAVDVDELSRGARPSTRPSTGDAYINVDGQWVRVKTEAPPGAPGEPPQPVDEGAEKLILQRVIEIPAQKLREADSMYNIVVRPGDSIYVREPMRGYIYIDGEIDRRGVYGLPENGRITLSRAITAAGGVNAIAIPERIDLVRMVGPNREAVMRVNVAAIRARTEPDIYLKPDDHIIIGTSFLATPLALLRAGFRTTYGFGFLLDRNFGNDVFGAPPTNQFGQ